jgi:hypothetical protein
MPLYFFLFLPYIKSYKHINKMCFTFGFLNTSILFPWSVLPHRYKRNIATEQKSVMTSTLGFKTEKWKKRDWFKRNKKQHENCLNTNTWLFLMFHYSPNIILIISINKEPMTLKLSQKFSVGTDIRITEEEDGGEVRICVLSSFACMHACMCVFLSAS